MMRARFRRIRAGTLERVCLGWVYDGRAKTRRREAHVAAASLGVPSAEARPHSLRESVAGGFSPCHNWQRALSS